MKQTAVEWLIKNSVSYITKELKDKALEMEKEQITDAYYEGKVNGMDISHPLSNTKEISAEEYYNETFKSE